MSTRVEDTEQSNDSFWSEASRKERAVQQARYDTLAGEYKRSGFELKVKGCVCEEIAKENFYLCYLREEFLTDDRRKRIAECKQAAEQGNVAAILCYGDYRAEAFFCRGGSVDDFLSTLCILKEAAELGSCEALRGIAFFVHCHSPIDACFVVDWFNKAIDNGACKKGWFLNFAGGIYKDLGHEDKAYEYFEKAALAGGNDTGRACGEMLSRDLKRALIWSKKEADINSDDSFKELLKALNGLLPYDYGRVYLRKKKIKNIARSGTS